MLSMTEDKTLKTLPGVRGAPEHELRRRILDAAEARFRHYGVDKTTVAEIASDLGISSAYIYKFYASKLAIAEAIVAEVLTRLADPLREVVESDAPASDRLRLYYQVLLERALDLFFHERKLHDMIRTSLDQQWQAVDHWKVMQAGFVRRILEDGRAGGEFETRTPLNDLVEAIWMSLVPFAHPSVLQHLHLDYDLPGHARHLADLVLRGLSRN